MRHPVVPIKLDKKLAWYGSLERLKLLVHSGLNTERQQPSTGAEVKQFASENYTMKWYGKKKQKAKQSAMSALIQMCDQWLQNMDNGTLNGVVFLDIRKAFGSIDHSILLQKMSNLEFMGELEWLESYLTKRQQVCFVNGHTSSTTDNMWSPTRPNYWPTIVFIIILMICQSIYKLRPLASMLTMLNFFQYHIIMTY